MFQAPAATAFDGVSSFLSAAVYVIVGLAALAQAPRDPRTRVFLAVALAGVAPYGFTAVLWERGPNMVVTKTDIMFVAISLMIGSLCLFHFTQVFPWRRPWIRKHASWLWSGYVGVVTLSGAAAMVVPSFELAGGSSAGSGGLGAVSPDVMVAGVALLLVLFPVLLILGVVTPLAALTSLYRNWLAARRLGLLGAQQTTMWMLVSQMAGGVLSILIIPVLRLIAPRGPWVTSAAALLFAFGLLMPVAFAAAVWWYRLLDTPADAIPQ